MKTTGKILNAMVVYNAKSHEQAGRIAKLLTLRGPYFFSIQHIGEESQARAVAIHLQQKRVPYYMLERILLLIEGIELAMNDVPQI